MNCLWCDREIITEISFKNILFLDKEKNICATCSRELERLDGNRCTRCSRRSDQTVCSDCSWWEKQKEMNDPLTFNYSLFTYNPRMQEIIAKWKYRGDYGLGEIFKEDFIAGFKRKFAHLPKDAVIIPIPLSGERIKERGFNQAQMLVDFLPLEKSHILTRVHNEKQSKKTRKERISTKNPFRLTESINKQVILVDDIYTTGTTLRHAAALLKENGCPMVYSYTLIRG